MSTPTPGTDRFHELLAARALDDIQHDENAELARLIAAEGDDESFDLLAARLDQALAPIDDEPVPASVLSSLHAAGERFLSESEPDVLASIAPPARMLGSLGWLAAAACLLIAALAWFPQRTATSPVGFDAVASAPGALTVGLSADLAGEKPIGSLVWDAQNQRGVMRFEGLALNDPSVEQYQLWIFDASRESFSESPLEIRHPVDGGVFDIAADGVVEVPIDAKVPVGQPVLFAVTIEPPGGVVVSDRSRIAAVGIPG